MEEDYKEIIKRNFTVKELIRIINDANNNEEEE